MEAFLRELCDESITSKSDLLTLAFRLGLKNPHQTVERLVRDHPRDIRQATWKFFCLWNNVDSSEHKLDKLKTAYSLMNLEGLYQKGTCISIATSSGKRTEILLSPAIEVAEVNVIRRVCSRGRASHVTIIHVVLVSPYKNHNCSPPPHTWHPHLLHLFNLDLIVQGPP